MVKKKAVIGVAGVLALGAGATAAAAPGGGGPLSVFGGDVEERKAERAKDLAEELRLPEDRVRRAIERVGAEHRAEHRAERAKGLAERLGVSQEAAARALERGREAARRESGQDRRGQGEQPGLRAFRPRQAHQAFLRAVAQELDKSVDEVRKALKDMRTDRLNAELDEAVKEGRLSREQADRIRRHAAEGPRRLRFRAKGSHRGSPGARNRNGDFLMPAPVPPDDADAAELPAPPPGEGP